MRMLQSRRSGCARTSSTTSRTTAAKSTGSGASTFTRAKSMNSVRSRLRRSDSRTHQPPQDRGVVGLDAPAA